MFLIEDLVFCCQIAANSLRQLSILRVMCFLKIFWILGIKLKHVELLGYGNETLFVCSIGGTSAGKKLLDLCIEHTLC